MAKETLYLAPKWSKTLFELIGRKPVFHVLVNQMAAYSSTQRIDQLSCYIAYSRRLTMISPKMNIPNALLNVEKAGTI